MSRALALTTTILMTLALLGPASAGAVVLPGSDDSRAAWTTGGGQGGGAPAGSGAAQTPGAPAEPGTGNAPDTPGSPANAGAPTNAGTPAGPGNGNGTPGAPATPGNGNGTPGAPGTPGNGNGTPGAPATPGNGNGTPGAPATPGNGNGTPGAPATPGNGNGTPGAPATPGNGNGTPGAPATPTTPGCNGADNPDCTGNSASAGAAEGRQRNEPVVHDDTDGLSEGEQWTREAPDAPLTDLAETIGLTTAPAAFAASTAAASDRVGVAVIDTGVAAVEGLGHVIHGPDLSFDSQTDGLAHLDGYGHGTHMAGIIGGRGVDGADGVELVGIAPDVDLYSLKVGSHSGAVDVTQVIAAIDWVAQHADELGIRVISLSYGTDSVQPWDVDPLAYAVEAAWRNGVVVVVSGGNDGDSRQALRNPAINPWILAVGASDSHGTPAVSDDTLAPFSNRGTEDRRVDVLAPGVGVVSYRVAGSVLDDAYPTARRGEAGFSGSGSSQSAAVVAGLAARLLQAHPDATPDQVKAALVASAQPIAGGDPATGAGVVNLAAALRALDDTATLTLQDLPEGEATGTLDAARGSARLEDGAGYFARRTTGVVLEGEIDVHGQPFDVPTWAAASAAARAWSDGTWNGVEWTGSAFEEDDFLGRSWAGRSWAGRSWAGRSWAGRSWAGRSWAGRSWAGDSWDADGGLFLSAGWLSLTPW